MVPTLLSDLARSVQLSVSISQMVLKAFLSAGIGNGVFGSATKKVFRHRQEPRTENSHPWQRGSYMLLTRFTHYTLQSLLLHSCRTLSECVRLLLQPYK